MAGLADSSPFPSSHSLASSPAPSNWPGSPSMPRPSPGGTGPQTRPGHSPMGAFIHSPQQLGAPSDPSKHAGKMICHHIYIIEIIYLCGGNLTNGRYT
jgi:hypothetical protein